MGTPDEKLWPGVTQLPDYKTSFPRWSPQDINKLVPHLSKDGKDLLKVMISIKVRRSLNSYIGGFIFGGFG